MPRREASDTGKLPDSYMVLLTFSSAIIADCGKLEERRLPTDRLQDEDEEEEEEGEEEEEAH